MAQVSIYKLNTDTNTFYFTDTDISKVNQQLSKILWHIRTIYNQYSNYLLPIRYRQLTTEFCTMFGAPTLHTLQNRCFTYTTNISQKTGTPRPDVSQYSLQYDRLYYEDLFHTGEINTEDACNAACVQGKRFCKRGRGMCVCASNQAWVQTRVSHHQPNLQQKATCVCT